MSPLRSPSITDASSLLRATPPLARASVFPLAVSATCRFPFASRAQVLTFHGKACLKVMPPIYRLPPAQYSGLPQAPPRDWKRPWFRQRLAFSIRLQRFACAHLLETYLTRSAPRLFPLRSPPRLLNAAAGGGLKPPPERRLRGTFPHLSHSIAQLSVERS